MKIKATMTGNAKENRIIDKLMRIGPSMDSADEEQIEIVDA